MKPLTRKQEAERWSELEVQTNTAYKAACDLDLEKLAKANFRVTRLINSIKWSNQKNLDLYARKIRIALNK